MNMLKSREDYYGGWSVLDEREGHTDPASLSVFQFVRVFEGMSENCCVHVFKSCQNFFLVQKNVCDLIEPL